jgi:hypothetical protein
LSKDQHLLSREERDERGRVLTRTSFTWTGRYPTSATTRDGNNAVTAQWTYKLQASSTPFTADDFDLDKTTKGASTNQIVEDSELEPITSYQAAAKSSADAAFNLGVAQIRHTEDYSAGFASLSTAARLKPQAVAPLIETFDAAINARDLIRAAQALAALTQLGGDSHAVAQRRLTLAVSQRDWSAANSAVQAAMRTRPADLSLRLTRANLLRLQGDFSAARELLLQNLASTSPQPEVQAASAQAYAETFSSVSTSGLAEAVAAQQALPQETQWQQLAYKLLELQTKQPVASRANVPLTNDTALFAWAAAQARSGQFATAIASYTTVASRAPLRLSTQSRRNLMVLHAARGDVARSLAAYTAVAARDEDEEARSRTRNTLFLAWRAVAKSEDLRRALSARASLATATEDDVRLWLAWQENYSTADAVGATVRSATFKFRNSAWWQSRLAEQLVAEAAAFAKDTTGKQERLTNEALAAVNKAIALDAAQPYYPVQAALIQTLRANDFRKAAIGDATATTEAVNIATAALDKLRTTRGNDPDISIAVAGGATGSDSTRQRRYRRFSCAASTAVCQNAKPPAATVTTPSLPRVRRSPSHCVVRGSLMWRRSSTKYYYEVRVHPASKSVSLLTT